MAQDKPDVVLQGEIQDDAHQTYRLVPFTVPTGVARITVEFAYTGREQRTTIDLGLIGPDGFRGWSGGNKSVFTVAATDATPSYLPGLITSGVWNLLLGIPNIRAGVRSEFTAHIFFSRTLSVRDEPEVLRRPLREGPAWYRGDFHAHTGHSDGHVPSQSGVRVPAPVFVTATSAAERGLDFIALTDHNATSHANSIRELQPYFDRLLLIPGRELTTFQGHANIFGTSEGIDFRVTSAAVPDWNASLHDVDELGALLSINHPIRPSDETCMGCGWTPTVEVDMRRVGAVEIVNGRDADTPYSGISFWHEQLNRGYRITGIGGSDTHGWRQEPAPNATTLGVGQPTTVVFAAKLSTLAILDAVRAGRVFVDVLGTTDRVLEFSAQSGSARANMGDELSAAQGSAVELIAHATHVPGALVEIIVDGEPLAGSTPQPITSEDACVAFTWTSDGEPHWLRANIRNTEGQLLLIGNPIYVNTRERQ